MGHQPPSLSTHIDAETEESPATTTPEAEFAKFHPITDWMPPEAFVRLTAGTELTSTQGSYTRFSIR